MEKKHILLIENDENEVEFFADALEESNLDFLCSTARNTEQAIRILKNIMPDIIFVDIRISKTAGSALSRKIKQIQSLRKVPVVMYSNVTHKKIKKRLQVWNLQIIFIFRAMCIRWLPFCNTCCT